MPLMDIKSTTKYKTTVSEIHKKSFCVELCSKWDSNETRAKTTTSNSVKNLIPITETKLNQNLIK